MKKAIIPLMLFLSVIFTNPQNVKSETYTALLESCTGTWCQWCPCGHSIIHDILQNFPNTVVLEYHGAGNDPWLSYSLGMIQAFGFNSYPTGVVGRKSGVIGRDGWNNEVVLQTLLIQPGVSITITSKNYEASTRTFSAVVKIKALADLTGDYYVNYVITEDNLVYPQTGNSSCAGGSSYVHNHVVKSMVNGDMGELIHSGSWTTGQEETRTINYVVPASPVVVVPENCTFNIFVYKQGSSISTNSNVQQSIKTSLTGSTGIVSHNSTPSGYSLSQNYPNPFNPSTHFNFSIPKNEKVSLKFYDILGNEVATYVDGILDAGTYSVEFDGSNLASGIYFYRLSTSGYTETKRMNLIK